MGVLEVWAMRAVREGAVPASSCRSSAWPQASWIRSSSLARLSSRSWIRSADLARLSSRTFCSESRTFFSERVEVCGREGIRGGGGDLC